MAEVKTNPKLSNDTHNWLKLHPSPCAEKTDPLFIKQLNDELSTLGRIYAIA